MNSVDGRTAEGAAALACGDWAAARAHFEASPEGEETTAALEGLSDALFWLEEMGPSIERRMRACMLYQEAGDACRAARAALWPAMIRQPGLPFVILGSEHDIRIDRRRPSLRGW